MASTPGSSVSRYFAKILEEIPRQPGVWPYLRVGVFRQSESAEELIGEYRRNYPTLYNTFCPFRLNGVDLALYSPDYTATRLMHLPDCRDIGGEEPSAGGFCPTDFYVPTFVDATFETDPPKVERHQAPTPELLRRLDQPGLVPLSGSTTPVPRHCGPVQYHPFGFVAGCVWGDDSSWKVQFLDLAKATEGLLQRDARFGYLPLPNGLTLSAAVDLTDFQYHPTEDDAFAIGITSVQRYDIRTGQNATGGI